MIVDPRWTQQRSLSVGTIVSSLSDKAFFLHLHLTLDGFNFRRSEVERIPKSTLMLVLSAPVYISDWGESCLCLLVGCCYGIGWIRIVQASEHCNSTLGYVIVF